MYKEEEKLNDLNFSYTHHQLMCTQKRLKYNSLENKNQRDRERRDNETKIYFFI